MDLNLFLGVSMVPLDYKNEVRKLKSENLSFLGHPNLRGTLQN